MIKIDILKQVVDISNSLDALDNYTNNLSEDLRQVNFKISDIEHLIENNQLKTNQCYRAIKKLHELRLERRKIKNDIELSNAFNQHQNKLLGIDNRKLLLSVIGKTDKALKNSVYKNRVYTEEELNEIIGS